MADNDGSRDRLTVPLTEGEFVLTIKRSDGKMGAFVGPTPLNVDQEDLWLKPNPENPMEVVYTDAPFIQRFVTLGPDQYAVIHNPTTAYSPETPNGSIQTGRITSLPGLMFGRKRVVSNIGNAGVRFLTWPGQMVTTHDVHRLTTSQYLLVEVESTDVDTMAPYYELTKRCAAIRAAQVDETVASQEEGAVVTVGTTPADASASEEQGVDASASEEQGADASASEEQGADASASEATTSVFVVGQRIIIPGNLTPAYVPPSGIRVVIDEEGNKDDETLPGSDLEVIEACIATGVLKIENLRDWLQKAGISQDYYEHVEATYRDYRQDGQNDVALIQGIRRNIERGGIPRLVNALREAAKQPQKLDLAIRQAVVLGPTEFCVLLDEDANPKTKTGPGRVFPGPYDHFRTEGSRDGVYQAYHLRTDRGILLRIVAEISREDLAKQLPDGINLPNDNKTTYYKGDELFIGGHDAYFVPSSAIEVINPKTRQPHVGNQHSDAYVTSIGVDQKSGVYVANVETGEVALVRGEKKLLLDPRKESHQHRRIPGRIWNLLIGRGEPHKRHAADDMVDTPWALSVIVPNNEAILVTSKTDRRVVLGPCTDLLDYEEWPEVLTLSGGTPKGSGMPIETCFLRVTGNRVSDIVEVVTSDLVTVRFTVRYGVTFVGSEQDEMAKWFNDTDYVGLLTENLRSRLRAAARSLALSELYAESSGFVRDTILGVKGEGDEHRPGHLFTENNMMVTEVEVLNVVIDDPTVAASVERANQAVVTYEIEGKSAEAALAAAKRRDAIAAEQAELDLLGVQRGEKVKTAQAESAERLQQAEITRERAREKAKQEFEAALETAKIDAAALLAETQRAMDDADAAADMERERKRAEAGVTFKQQLAAIEQGVLAAAAKADVDRLGAIQPGFIEALRGASENALLQTVAENLPPATGELGLALGVGGFTGLLKMLGNSNLAHALEKVGKRVEDVTTEVATTTSEATEEAGDQ